MDASIISALAAVAGSLMGGLASITTAWVTQRTQSKCELMRAEISKRETLYADFSCECSRLLMDRLCTRWTSRTRCCRPMR